MTTYKPEVVRLVVDEETKLILEEVTDHLQEVMRGYLTRQDFSKSLEEVKKEIQNIAKKTTEQLDETKSLNDTLKDSLRNDQKTRQFLHEVEERILCAIKQANTNIMQDLEPVKTRVPQIDEISILSASRIDLIIQRINLMAEMIVFMKERIIGMEDQLHRLSKPWWKKLKP